MAGTLKEIEVVLQKEYEEFMQTEEGKRWKDDWVNKYNGRGDFGDYLYDFYPEYLM
ncbi:MAG: hypothetical protein IKY27_00305 [Bacteroidales bacterium]|nr:hypothetical protein [Bacteroidales bacterium]